MPVRKKPVRKKTPPAKPLGKLGKSHAKKLFSSINALLASSDHGFAAKVSEIHLMPVKGDDFLDCGDCPPPKICKRVCFINDQGVPECEDQCVDA